MEQEPQKSEEEVKGSKEQEDVPIRRSTRRRVPVKVTVKEVKKATRSTGNSLLDMMNSLEDDDDDDSSEYSEQSESSSSSSSEEQDEQEKNGSKREAKQAKISRKEEERREKNDQNQSTKKDQEGQQHVSTLPLDENAPDQNVLPEGHKDIPEAFVYSLPTTLPNFLFNKLITKYK